MLDFDQLTFNQKKYVALVGAYFPLVKDEVTFSQLEEMHATFMDLRAIDPKYKIGFPKWLMQKNRTGAGTYFFPSEGAIPPVSVKDDINNFLEQLYQKELAEHA